MPASHWCVPTPAPGRIFFLSLDEQRVSQGMTHCRQCPWVPGWSQRGRPCTCGAGRSDIVVGVNPSVGLVTPIDGYVDIEVGSVGIPHLRQGRTFLPVFQPRRDADRVSPRPILSQLSSRRRRVTIILASIKVPCTGQGSLSLRSEDTLHYSLGTRMH